MPIHFFSESPRSFGDSFTRRTSLTQQPREPKGKEKESVEFPYDQDSVLPNFTSSTISHDSSVRYQSTSKPLPKPPRKPRTSLLFSLVRKKTSSTSPGSQYEHPLIMPGIIEITRPYSYVEEEEERERLRDAAAQSIGLVDYATEHPGDTQEDLQPTIEPSSSPIPSSRIPSPTPTPTLLHHLPPFPTSLASLSQRITLSGSFPKFCPPSSLLVYALSKQWKTRCIVLTTAIDGRASQAVTHLHLFKSNLLSSSELHRLPITQDTAIYVAEQAPTINSSTARNTTRRRGSGGKSSGSIVAIEQGEIIWHFEMQDPNERQKWIGAIKAVVLGQRSMRAGLTASPHVLSGHEPRGDMDVMLSMRLQASLSSAASPISPVTSPRTSSPAPVSASTTPPISQPTSPIRTSLSLEGLRSQTHSPTPSTSTNTELFTRGSSIKSKSQSYNNARRSGSSSGPASGSSSPTQSIHLHSKRSGNLSIAIINSPTHSTKSSTSTTKTIKGMFTPRSRSPSLSREREGDYTEESFGTVGSSLMGIGSGMGSINRSGSPMYRAESPVPSIASSGRDGSSVHVPYESLHNGNGNGNSSNGLGSASINGIPACDLKIVKEDERSDWSCPYTHAPPIHAPSLSHPHSHSASHSHSLHPPPRCRKQTLVHPLADVVCQQMDSAPSIQTSIEDPTVTPRAVTPTPMPNPARLSVHTISTTTSGSGVERSGSTSSTPSRRWSRTLPKRLTPPSGPLPLTPPQAPYESEMSVSPSPASSDNPGAAFWKRASGSSSLSSASARSSLVHPYPTQRASMVGPFGTGVGVGIGGGSIGVGSKRRSMPPPRPAPSFAPPPAPEQQPQPQQPQQSQKTRFRTSVAQRALRLSLTAPRPPPSGVLPPRPDEPVYTHHRRSSSNNSIEIPPRPDSAASSRSMSIKQRLRILSAPSPVIAPNTLPLPDHSEAISISIMPHVISSSSSSSITSGNSSIKHSRPPTPLLPGTPITTMQNHPDFLQFTTPTQMLPSLPPRNPLRPPPQRLPSAPEITSLSPPPRRGSKQLVAQYLTDSGNEKEKGDESGREGDEEKEMVDSDSELPDFSDIRVHAGSVVSLGFVALE
ncbi:uncharacterized protein EDB91DRAFT_1245982 [Suillus paluster]|uniref:uncharacterized protein n=1 Tax=Suillus paluster TaxID=48578 RepID=UPI001B85C25D|nr:uncharacterized protein EDB91DRAFT_1245982 [Suillus paluster]KAG1745835.1 hypothetical protein EDB91DRAFT_1245982 [Suillus paluster]